MLPSARARDWSCRWALSGPRSEASQADRRQAQVALFWLSSWHRQLCFHDWRVLAEVMTVVSGSPLLLGMARPGGGAKLTAWQSVAAWLEDC